MEVWGSEFSHILGNKSTRELLRELLRDECLPSSWRSVEQHTCRDRDLKFLILSIELFEEFEVS
jgi:hypothetical protein